MIDLYFWPTPNGYKAAIMLAEVGMLDNVIPVDITAGDQFKPEYVAISPHSKVPAIVDHNGWDGIPYPVFESGAILMYLAEKTGMFMPSDVFCRYEVLKWLMFQVSGFGPMLGQAHHFRVYAPETIDYAVERYTNEAERLYRVLERRLSQVEYMAGEYSIADIATFPWVRTRKMHGQNLDNYPNIKRWYDTIKARPGVRKGIDTLSDKKRWEIKSGSDEWQSLFSKA